MQNPPPPPSSPPPSGPPPMGPPGQPPMMPPGGGGAMAMPAAGNLASPGLRIVGGLIDVVIIYAVTLLVYFIFQKASALAGIVNLVLGLGYFGYFLSQRGQTVGMMVFGFKVRDAATGQFPDVGKSILRGFIWLLEVGLTWCLIGALGWLWMLWDPQKQAIHDKVAGTIVTTS